MPMEKIDQLSTAAGQENVHGAMYPPLDNKAVRDANHMTVNNAGGWSINNNMNQVTLFSVPLANLLMCDHPSSAVSRCLGFRFRR